MSVPGPEHAVVVDLRDPGHALLHRSTERAVLVDLGEVGNLVLRGEALAVRLGGGLLARAAADHGGEDDGEQQGGEG